MNARSQVVTAVSMLAFALLSTEVSSNDKAKVQADAVKVRETLTGMGATFIKVGQVLANRPDIIRADYMDELTKLQVNLPYICPFMSVTDTTHSHYHALSHRTRSRPFHQTSPLKLWRQGLAVLRRTSSSTSLPSLSLLPLLAKCIRQD